MRFITEIVKCCLIVIKNYALVFVVLHNDIHNYSHVTCLIPSHYIYFPIIYTVNVPTSAVIFIIILCIKVILRLFRWIFRMARSSTILRINSNRTYFGKSRVLLNWIRKNYTFDKTRKKKVNQRLQSQLGNIMGHCNGNTWSSVSLSVTMSWLNEMQLLNQTLPKP